MQSVDQTLETHKVANHLEDPENSHNPQKPDYLPSFPNDVKVLKSGKDDREEVGDQCHQVDLDFTLLTCFLGSTMRADCTKFIPSMINLFLFGEMRSLATYSTKKKLTATVSKACEKENHLVQLFSCKPGVPPAAPSSPPPSPRWASSPSCPCSGSPWRGLPQAHSQGPLPPWCQNIGFWQDDNGDQITMMLILVFCHNICYILICWIVWYMNILTMKVQVESKTKEMEKREMIWAAWKQEYQVCWEEEKAVLYLKKKNNKQRIHIETDSTSFGHITTQQSQPLYKVTTSPNNWKFPWIYIAPRLLVSLAKNKRTLVEIIKTQRRSEVLVHLLLNTNELSAIPFWAPPCQIDPVRAQQCDASKSSFEFLVGLDTDKVADCLQN